jgi:hypothetical protein
MEKKETPTDKDKIKTKHQRKKYFSLKKMSYRKNQFMAQHD